MGFFALRVSYINISLILRVCKLCVRTAHAHVFSRSLRIPWNVFMQWDERVHFSNDLNKLLYSTVRTQWGILLSTTLTIRQVHWCVCVCSTFNFSTFVRTYIRFACQHSTHCTYSIRSHSYSIQNSETSDRACPYTRATTAHFKYDISLSVCTWAHTHTVFTWRPPSTRIHSCWSQLPMQRWIAAICFFCSYFFFNLLVFLCAAYCISGSMLSSLGFDCVAWEHY